MDVACWVLDRVRFPGETVHIIDMECGDGQYLGDFLWRAREAGAKIQSYGLEMNLANVYEARRLLNRVLPGGYSRSEISHRSFSMVYTRPRETKRSIDIQDPVLAALLPSREKDILQRATTYLQVGGVLVMQVKREQLKGLSNLIAHRLEDVEIALTGDEAVVFGRRAPVRPLTPETREQLLQVKRWVEEMAESEERYFFPEAERQFTLPVTSGPSIFKSDVIDPVLLAEKVATSGLWAQMEEWLKPQIQGGTRPPLPLHLGHIGLLLSTGLLDGRVANHLVKGRIVKTETESTEQTNEGIEVYTKHGHYKVEARILESDGSYIDL